MIALSFLLSLSACLLWTGAEGQSSGQLRLVARNGQTSSSLTAGRLEVYYSGRWGTVCDDRFGTTEADVACRQLGFSDNLYDTNVGFTSSSFATRFTQASSSTPIWFDTLDCSLSNSRLIDCASSIGSHDCTHAEDVVLFCEGDGAVRLSTSSLSLSTTSLTTSAGRVEVYYNGVWGTVCDDFFDQTDADVVCRQLGYPSASTYGRVGSLGYSQGSGRIWLTNLGCTSSDLMLSTCSNSGFGNTLSCSHFEDVAVSCNTLNSDLTSAITSAVIAGIVIAVLVPLCCIGICVTIIVIAVCTGACAAGAASRGRRRNVNVAAAAATIPPPVATATVVTGTGAAVSAPPPYTSAAYPTQPPQGDAPAAYPQQPGYPPQAGGAGYPPYPGQAGGAPQQQPPAAYPPQQPPADEQKVELQQYPADPAYPPQPYPAAGYPPPTNQ